ncbi:MAG: GNAT family N-acetyltransferase [Candidatus Eremiobacteraeota bacterium]|nr:GNAT family N-acetyltransferase [Candidatus Eremiobacteraeota bacterium]
MNKYVMRAPNADEFEIWYALYHAFSVAVHEEVTREIGEEIWKWINDPKHPTKAIIAESDGQLAGFVHYRPFPRTLHGNEACYLDDLYVLEDHRGSGLARQLIDAVSAIAKERGWTHVRWVTEEKNMRARAFYEKFAEPMTLITFKID